MLVASDNRVVVPLEICSAARKDIAAVVSWFPTADAAFLWSGNRLGCPVSAKALRSHVRSVRRNSGVVLAARSEGSETLGYAELVTSPTTESTGRLARICSSPSERRSGIATSLIAHLCDTAFQRKGLARLELNVFEANVSAVALYRAIGFKVEGQLREARLQPDGTRVDVIVMGLLPSEWAAR